MVFDIAGAAVLKFCATTVTTQEADDSAVLSAQDSYMVALVSL